MFNRRDPLVLKLLLFFGAFVFLGTFAFSSQAGVKNPAKNLGAVGEKQNYLPIIGRWSGDYPIAQIDRLREWHAQAHAGYIGDEAGFGAFWQVFKQGTAVPRVDFSKNLVVFVIGNEKYKQIVIDKVTLKDNVAEMVADGYMSGQSHEDSLAAALAVIPRAGVKFVRLEREQAAVE